MVQRRVWSNDAVGQPGHNVVQARYPRLLAPVTQREAEALLKAKKPHQLGSEAIAEGREEEGVKEALVVHHDKRQCGGQ